MRAMQIIEWGKPLEAREYPDPEPTGEEVLVRVEAAGVCHSDVHIWDGFFDLGGGQQISLESRGCAPAFYHGARDRGRGGRTRTAGLWCQGRRQGGGLPVDRLRGMRGVPEGRGTALP